MKFFCKFLEVPPNFFTTLSSVCYLSTYAHELISPWKYKKYKRTSNKLLSFDSNSHQINWNNKIIWKKWVTIIRKEKKIERKLSTFHYAKPNKNDEKKSSLNQIFEEKSWFTFLKNSKILYFWLNKQKLKLILFSTFSVVLLIKHQLFRFFFETFTNISNKMHVLKIHKHWIVDLPNIILSFFVKNII